MRRCHCAANEHAAGRDGLIAIPIRTTMTEAMPDLAIAGVTVQSISAARRARMRYPSTVVDFDLRQ
jgi:hypothetical protein